MPELRIHGAIFILPGPSEGEGPWQFPSGAQVGTNGVNALALLGTNVLSSPVWRVDGACVTNGVSIADMLCTNGVFRTPSSFAIEWKNTTGVATNADTDCDGISDWDEVFLHGTSPVRPSFALSATLPSLNGSSSVGSGKWKCNAFVAYCAMSVGQTVPVTGGHPPISSYPPVANNWAMGSTIPGWTFLGTGIDPEPGWICGHPQPGGLGHVGIVDYDGHCIAAGTYNVNRRYKRFLDGSCGYNRFGD